MKYLKYLKYVICALLVLMIGCSGKDYGSSTPEIDKPAKTAVAKMWRGKKHNPAVPWTAQEQAFLDATISANKILKKGMKEWSTSEMSTGVALLAIKIYEERQENE